MGRRLSRQEAAALPLLRGESATELANIIDSLFKELQPQGPILKLYITDYAYFLWEIRRLRQWKTAVVENAFYAALKGILSDVLDSPLTWGFKFEDSEEPETPETLAQKWFIDEAVREEILELLGDLRLDETNIEAEAARSSSDTLEVLDKMMASAEARRDKTLRTIAEYRASFANLLNKAGQKIIEGEAVEVENPAALAGSTDA